MKVGIPREVKAGERRVAGTPSTVKRLQKLGFEVLVETDAGTLADYTDDAYVEAGASIVDAETVWAEADIVTKLNPPEEHPSLGKHELDLLKDGATLISFFWPGQNEELCQKAMDRGTTNVIAMDKVPRITRAQKLDALSSLANLSGYRAVVEAAHLFGRFFTGQMTAAGKLPPARVLVVGAGVAGLAAIGAAKGMGAVVKAFDTRPVVKEQVESMGAEFIELEFEEDGTGEGGYAKVMSEAFIEAEMAMFAEEAKTTNIIITTALIPGRPAPKLITKETALSMPEGSVIVDLAAVQGGNCELTVPGEVADHGNVKVIGYRDLANLMPQQASQLYGMNCVHMLDELGGAEGFGLDHDNEVIRGSLAVEQGEKMWPPPKVEKPPAPKPAPVAEAAAAPAPTPKPAAKKKKSGGHGPEKKPPGTGSIIALAVAGFALIGVGSVAPPSFLAHLTVFVLAIFVGWQIIWNVAPALHTPLMSVTNAISGIIIIAGLLQVTGDVGSPATILGAIAVLIATINVAGGFLVTQRMLKMFRR